MPPRATPSLRATGHLLLRVEEMLAMLASAVHHVATTAPGQQAHAPPYPGGGAARSSAAELSLRVPDDLPRLQAQRRDAQALRQVTHDDGRSEDRRHRSCHRDWRVRIELLAPEGSWSH